MAKSKLEITIEDELRDLEIEHRLAINKIAMLSSQIGLLRKIIGHNKSLLKNK